MEESQGLVLPQPVMDLLSKLGEAIPYAVLYVVIVLIMLNAEDKRDEKRVTNATALENKREAHEKAMQDKQLQHERDLNTLWAIQQKETVTQMMTTVQDFQQQVIASNTKVIERMDAFDEKDEERYKRLGVTQDLLKAAAAMGAKKIGRAHV